MRPRYHQITHDERLVIKSSMLAEGQSQAAVAAAIGVHRSSICRERRRGLLGGSERYFSVIA